MKRIAWHQAAYFSLLLLTVVLVGCSQVSEITLLQDQFWTYRTSFSYDQESIPELDVSGDIVEGFSLGVGTSLLPPDLVEAAISQAAVYYRNRGYAVGWEKDVRDSEYTYTIVVNGQGWQALSDLFLIDPESMNLPPEFSEGLDFSGTTMSVQVTDLGDGRLQFRADAPLSPLGFLVSTSFDLRGGKISEANTQDVRGGRATWVPASGLMTATLTPASSVGSMPWVAIFGLLVAGGALILLLVRVRKRQRGREAPLPWQY